MNKRVLASVGALALTVSVGVAVPASASPANAGATCVQSGLGTLKSLGLLQAAAKKQIDYSTLADAESGPIFAELPVGTYLSLGQVVKLHKTSPELFAWCSS